MGVWRWTKSAGGAASQGVRANPGSDSSQATNNNVALSGSATNGTAPYTYAWTVVSQPSGVTSASITSATSASATLTGISGTVNGTYVCRLTVTDAGGFLSTDRVSVDVQVVSGAEWRTVMDLNFATMTAGALTENGAGTSTVDGVQYYARVRNTGDMSFTMTDGTGLVCDFASTTTGENRISFLVGDRLTLSPEGLYPRIRIAACFESLVAPTAGDYLGVGMNVMWRDHNDGYMPRTICKYRRYGGDYNWYAQCEKGTWGNAASGSEVSGIVDAAEVDNGVMSCLDAGGGVFQARGHTGDATIAAPGVEPFLAMVTICGFNDFTTNKPIYRSDGGARGFDGPYAMLVMRNASNSSQAVTWTRLVVEEFS